MNIHSGSGNNEVTIIGCGYIGKLLAQKLLAQSIATTGIVSSDTSIAECRNNNIPCLKLDLDKPPDGLVITGQRIIYLAPPPAAGQKDTRINNFLHAVDEHAPARFVLISTTGVYGDCKGAWIDETRPLKPVADRAIRRVDAEQQTTRFCERHEIPLVILRVPGIYGPGRIPVARIRKGEPVVDRQDSPFTNRIHAFDLVNICEKALLDQHISGIYNVSDGHPSTMYDFFTGIAETMGLPKPPSISLQEARRRLSAGMMSYMSESRRIDNSKLLNDFRLELEYPDLQTGLRSILHDK